MAHRCCRNAQGPEQKFSWRVTRVQVVNIIFIKNSEFVQLVLLMWLLKFGPLLLVGGERSWFGWHPDCSSSRTCSAATATARIRASLLRSSGESACCRQSSDWKESLPFKVLQQQLRPRTWFFLPKCLVLHSRHYEMDQNSAAAFRLKCRFACRQSTYWINSWNGLQKPHAVLLFYDQCLNKGQVVPLTCGLQTWQRKSPNCVCVFKWKQNTIRVRVLLGCSHVVRGMLAI